MVFSEPFFVFRFLPVVLFVHFVLPHRLRNLWLLTASLYFYFCGEAEGVLIMAGSILANYSFGRLLEKYPGRRRMLTALAVVLNLGALGVFKYADFIVDNLNQLLSAFEYKVLPRPGIKLPIGISFFTFQALSYVLDVARGSAPVQKRLSDFGLYVALFPQLIAGPVVRYADVAAQITQRCMSRAAFAEGVRRFVVGLSKKILIANTVAQTSAAVYAIPSAELTTDLAWLGVVAYTLQIYFDFSGYSDMAIGLGLMFGFRFLENFRHPYAADSITEFWRRWHISLSSWFRDYVYIPLGGNRAGVFRTWFNLVLVFLLCGLWHGAAWNFLIWGAYHGAFLVFERMGLGRLLAACPRPLRHLYVMPVVMVGWAFFNADSLSGATPILRALFGQGAGWIASLDSAHHVPLYLDREHLAALLIGIMASVPWWRVFTPPHDLSRNSTQTHLKMVVSQSAKTLGLTLLMLLCAVTLAAQTQNPFIYFRF